TLSRLDQNNNPRDHKRYAQDLPHIDRQVFFEWFLYLLEEFVNESKRPQHYEKHAKNKPGAYLVALVLPYVIQQTKEQETIDGFVQLRRVPGHIVDKCEYKSPWNIGGYADDFRVHQVAQANEGACNADYDHQAVDHPEVIVFQLTAEEVKPDKNADGRAVTGKARVRRQNDRQGIGEKDGRVVKEKMTEACAEKCGNNNVQG